MPVARGSIHPSRNVNQCVQTWRNGRARRGRCWVPVDLRVSVPVRAGRSFCCRWFVAGRGSAPDDALLSFVMAVAAVGEGDGGSPLLVIRAGKVTLSRRVAQGISVLWKTVLGDQRTDLVLVLAVQPA